MAAYQQGDVWIEQLAPHTDTGGINFKKIETAGQYVLAKGEVTGHCHRVIAEGLVIYENQDGRILMRLPSGGIVQHEEHSPITLPEGNYVVRKVREYDHFAEEAREVRD